MKKQYILIIGALLILGGLVFFLPTAQAPEPQSVTSTSTPTSLPTPPTFTHTFKKGTHTLIGTLTLPTPCYQVAESVEIDDTATPEQVTVAITTSTDDGLCVQVIDERLVEVSFDASADAVITATLNGKPLTITEDNG